MAASRSATSGPSITTKGCVSSSKRCPSSAGACREPGCCWPGAGEGGRLAEPLGSTVVFAGRVPHAEIRRLYSLIDVFVCPRRRMRLTELVTPLKPLEAMAMGKPVLASDVGGLKELVSHETTGLLFP